MCVFVCVFCVLYVYVSVFVCVYVYTTVHIWKSEDNFAESVFSSQVCADSRDQTELSSSHDKCLSLTEILH